MNLKKFTSYNMNKEIEEKFVDLLSKVKDEELKGEFLKYFLEVSSLMDDLVIKNNKKGCVPCISNCNDNNFCNDNETEVSI